MVRRHAGLPGAGRGGTPPFRDTHTHTPQPPGDSGTGGSCLSAAGPFLAKYAESGFEAVWFASAFKGTTGPAQTWPPLSYHLKNHLSWLKVMQALPQLAPLRFQGIVLTGWQR